MIKYTPSNQLSLSEFSHPFEQELLSDNRWVKLSQLIPWDALAKVYSNKLNARNGRESIDVRMVIGAIIVKHKIGLNDRETVAMISENIYLHYFCGLKCFQTKPPFHPTVLVAIRKRMGAVNFDSWNTLIIEKADSLKPKRAKNIQKNTEEDAPNQCTSGSKHKGKLKIDASVADQRIVFPTDAGLLNTARKESERIIDLLYEQTQGVNKPRDYRRVARTEYLVFSKKRRKTTKQINKFIRKQLGYTRRNLSYIEKLLDQIEDQKKGEQLSGMFTDLSTAYPCKFPLPKRDQKIYWVLQLIYEQQYYMYHEKVNSVKNRIVNIYQPYARPILRPN